MVQLEVVVLVVVLDLGSGRGRGERSSPLPSESLRVMRRWIVLPGTAVSACFADTHRRPSPSLSHPRIRQGLLHETSGAYPHRLTI